MDRPHSHTLLTGAAVGRWHWLLLIVLVLVAARPCPAWSDRGPDFSADHDPATLYRAAKDYYYRLERDPGPGSDRANWLRGIRSFRRIYLLDTDSELAPSSLYMIGRMYRRCYQRFHIALDLDAAIEAFTRLARDYPRNSLADDALFTVGNIYEKEKNDPAGAARIYRQQIRTFSKGDRYAQAVNRLRELSRTKKIALPEQLTRSQALHHLVRVRPVRYWSSAHYTRVVVQTAAPVQYRASLLEKDGDQPRRIYIDLAQCFIPPESRNPVPIGDGLLKQVRTGQLDDSTVRVVLDIQSISDYKIFSLKDPFRVVIDVHGERAGKGIEKGTVFASDPGDRAKQEPRLQDQTRPAAPRIVVLRDRKKRKPNAAHQGGDKAATLSLAQQLGLGIHTIIIDPGHGGRDPGAMGNGLKEKDVVLAVARRLRRILESEYHYRVLMTRDNDVFLPLEERTALANTSGADLFVSIHVNAHPDKSARGVETFYLNLATNSEAMRVAALENATSTHNISEMQDILTDLMKNSKILESSRLAQFVQADLVSGLKRRHYPVRDLGVKQAPFYVLIGAEMPAILAEISFITNPREARLLKDPDYLEDIAAQIAAGIASYVDHHRSAALRLMPR